MPGTAGTNVCEATLIACVLVSLVCASCDKGLSSRNQNRPNVILISIDTLRADHLHGYGYERETSPTLDDLMRRGTSFLNAISAAPWTLPSHMSIFTSLYPHTHGVTREILALNDSVPTLTTALKEAGYSTGGIATMPHLSSRHGFGRGFDMYVCREVRAPVACEEALNWLSHIESKPFFLFLHLFDVHSDYDPLPQYLQLFETSTSSTIDGSGATLYKVRDGDLALSKDDLGHLTALYDAEIRQLDNTLGILFDALQRRGLVSNSIIVVTSDHGEEFLDHGGVMHGQTLYDEIVRVPLILAGPDIPAGGLIGKQVASIDIMPTILDLCNVRIPSEVQGRSLRHLIRDNDAKWEEITFSEADWRNEKHDIKRALRTDRYKFCYNRYTKREELYDLLADPAEQSDIIDTQPQVAGQLRKELHDWMATAWGSPEMITLTTEEEERLRALGYLN